MSTYELWAHKDDGTRERFYTLAQVPEPRAWELAVKCAAAITREQSRDVVEALTGKRPPYSSAVDIHLVQPRRNLIDIVVDAPPESLYVATSCGGDLYWNPPNTTMHQVGSAGFCWDCLRDERGLVRHPITPDEVLSGAWQYRCAVCDAQMTPGGEKPHLDMDHTVIWGEEDHPRCEYCGKGYQTATPEGIGYVEHDKDCWAIADEGVHILLNAEFERDCPVCPGKRGHSCLDEHGKRRDQLHKDRVDAWLAREKS